MFIVKSAIENMEVIGGPRGMSSSYVFFLTYGLYLDRPLHLDHP